MKALALIVALLMPASACASPGGWAHPVHDMKPRGVMLTIHGGSWIGHGAAYVRSQPTLIYRQQGWITDNIDYRPGTLSIMDVAAAYDAARHRYPHLPVCAAGQSAGGNLALLLAVHRPQLACVISEEGAATMVPLYAGQTAPSLLGSIRFAFTPADAVAFSPALHLKHYRGRILASYSMDDHMIPGGPQFAALRAAVSPARITVVPITASTTAGSVQWVHFRVTPAQLASWQQQQRTFLRGQS